MSLFSTLDAVAMSAALMECRTVPVTPHVLNEKGMPAMIRGRFQWKALRELYALNALDELYQTLWRTAVRNNQPVEAIIVVPDAEWLSVLWRTVMPGFTVHAAHQYDEKGFRRDPSMEGLAFLMGVQAGREFEKADIARLMGYTCTDPWKSNKERIMTLLSPFFEEGSTNRVLRRKPSWACRSG